MHYGAIFQQGSWNLVGISLHYSVHAFSKEDHCLTAVVGQVWLSSPYLDLKWGNWAGPESILLRTFRNANSKERKNEKKPKLPLMDVVLHTVTSVRRYISRADIDTQSAQLSRFMSFIRKVKVRRQERQSGLVYIKQYDILKARVWQTYCFRAGAMSWTFTGPFESLLARFTPIPHL